ncbi:hypothetical protein EHS25_000418 [Saitozyma podzolica]|uniref:Alpha/beta hydrolase fold-3 domain-containing protein n=1 Tax=Saitozyma podzolica TaxID=1890683 RepID=A0A427YWE9_9TREE|nr:hypothetical protein EHS25_000418 [Saitozyma podzolica]
MVTYGLLDVNYPAYALPIPEPDEGLVSKALEGMCETGVPHQPPEIVTPRVAWLQKQLRDATLLPYLYGDPTHPLSLPKTYNPISLLTPSFPPTFVLIASADKLLDPQQSRNFRDRLQELEVVVSSAEIPMEHGLADFAPDNDEMERMYRPWFEQGIGPGLDWVVQRLRE